MNKKTFIIISVTLFSLTIGWGIGSLLLERIEKRAKSEPYAHSESAETLSGSKNK